MLDTLSVLGDQYEILGLVDLKDASVNASGVVHKGTSIDGRKILGNLDELLRLTEGAELYIAATRDNRARADAAKRAEVCGIYPIKVFHPRATLVRSAKVESGVILHPGAVVGPHAVIKAGSILSTQCSVEAYSVCGPFAHIDVGAHVASRVTVGPYVTVGAGSLVLPKVTIHRGAIVAPGSVVTHDVEEYCVVSGSPARVMQKLPKPKDAGTSIYEQGAQQPGKAEGGTVPDSSPNVADESPVTPATAKNPVPNS